MRRFTTQDRFLTTATLAICLLSHFVTTLEPVKVHTLYYLTSNAMTPIVPFQIGTDARDTPSDLLSLHVSCSPDVTESVLFLPQDNSFCKDLVVNGTVQELNSYLSSLKASCSGTSGSTLWITYQLNNTQNDNVFSISQTFSVVSHIPVNLLSTLVKLDVSQSTSAARVAVLTVDQNYQASFGLDSISVSGLEEAGVTFHFEDNIMYMLPAKDDKSLISQGQTSLKITLTDSSTKLSSDPLKITLIFTNTSSNRSAKFKVLAVVGAFLSVFGIAALCCIMSWKRQSSGADLQHSIDAKQLASLPTEAEQSQEKTVVLTESIVSWNKRMLEKHKNKSEQMNNEDTNIVILGRDRARKSEHGFGERHHRREDMVRENSRRYRPFDDISEINIESMDLKSPVDGGANHSFLEDFNL